MSGLTPSSTTRVRAATAADAARLLQLWGLVYAEADGGPRGTWREPARRWFLDRLAEGGGSRFPVVERDGVVVATAVGTLEAGVPNPHCPRGRTVQLANVVTAAEHRRRGYATLLVQDVIGWARSVDADRVDLSTSADGLGLYQRLGFTFTTAPRMKLVL
ncbi:MAG TPA: GNAT family N-acetyltransferase [Motilibacteraceae bacterium]|nr:GNAT family N-acetyltransferase [Motilibacteraceae bacterium]